MMMGFAIENWLTIISITAIFASPMVAFWVSDKVGRGREIRSRQYQILRDLMSTRRSRLDPIHISALNLVELEFYNIDMIRQSYKKYVKHLSTPFPNGERQEQPFIDERNDLFAELLAAVASELGFKFDKSDLSRLAISQKQMQYMQRMNMQILRLFVRFSKVGALFQFPT
ncbi:hypothetical protein N8306_04425 [Yoonia sp.]|nr:hypothetical protein [Yoonia sp.]